MPGGPKLIFDKSSLESVNLDEAVLLDEFYSSVITPLFFVECLADLEKTIRSKSTPEQLVGSLADRTPEAQAVSTAFHLDALRAELSGQFDLSKMIGKPYVPGGKAVQLGDHKGMIFKQTKEEEALQRWTAREFLQVERQLAKWWRRSLMAVDFNAMVTAVVHEIGWHWRKPKSLQDARQLADIIIDHMDPEWLLGFGIDLLGASEAKEWVLKDWIARRRPALRQRYPYFIFMLSINLFFCLVLPTQLLRNVKPSHHVDLAYLYYLPFCQVFTSKDNFHVQIVPLFLFPDQTFVNGIELKEDLKKLDELYSGLPESELRQGLTHFARHPPEDAAFLTTQLWDRYLPRWREPQPAADLDPQLQKALLDTIKKLSESPELRPHNERDMTKLDYVSMERKIHLRKGKWRRYSEDMERRIIESQR
jgi:hypothetical protein